MIKWFQIKNLLPTLNILIKYFIVSMPVVMVFGVHQISLEIYKLITKSIHWRYTIGFIYLFWSFIEQIHKHFIICKQHNFYQHRDYHLFHCLLLVVSMIIMQITAKDFWFHKQNLSLSRFHQFQILVSKL